MVAHSSDLLGQELARVERLLALSSQGRRLIARLIMRTTAVIRTDTLNYTEIGDLDSTLDELTAADLVEINGDVAADALLERLKVAELKALFPDLVRPRDRKPDLMQRILASYTDFSVRACCAARVSWVQLTLTAALQRIRLAYFGDLYRDLTEFVMRDLGVSQFETYPLGDNARAFASALDADHYIELSSLQFLPTFRRHAAHAWLLSHSLVQNPHPENPSLRRRRDRLLIGWGRDFERANDHLRAHACYERATAHPARERRVRMFKKEGDDDSSIAMLEAIRSAPFSAEELLFATRFGVRSKPGKSATPWCETTWTTPHAQLPGVEMLTARHLTANGGRAWHTENSLLPTLLGLAFWDILFTPVPGMFTHPFQAAPRDLHWPDFRARRASAVSERLSECASADRLWSRIYTTANEKAGRACRLVNWHLVAHDSGAVLNAAREAFAPESLQGVFDYMLNDLSAVRSGMPDLFVAYGGGKYELVEVKGPSDQLQPNQRVWLANLCELGMACRVIKHKFVPA